MPFLPLFAGIHHSLAHVLTVPPTKVWLLCTTPAGLHLYIQAMPVGTYWVQSPGFLKIVYYHRLCKGKHGFSVSAWWFQAPALRVTLWEPHDPVGVSKCDSLYICECVKVQLWGGDSSVVRAPDSWLKGRGFESLLERRENFLLQGRFSVLTLISVSVPPPCYHSST